MKISTYIVFHVVLFLTFPPSISAENLAEQFLAISRMLKDQSDDERNSSSFQVTYQSYQQLIEEAGRLWQVDPLLIFSVIKHESDFEPSAISKKGACGLMQLMPATAEELGVTAIFDPWQNIHGGTRYLRLMYDRYAGDLIKTLQAYNTGPGNVDKGRIADETIEYTDRVINTYNQLRRQ